MEWKKFKSNYPYVEIWWDDAAALDSGWLSPEEFQKLKKEPQVVLTRGWLIEETTEHLYYCCDVGPKGETNGRGQIPKKMVKELNYITARTKKPKPTKES